METEILPIQASMLPIVNKPESIKCLFLQGDSKTGKSTLILESIRPYINFTAGFMCQRLVEQGETMAFCLTPIEKAGSPIRTYDAKIPNIFLENISGKWAKNDRVFNSEGVRLLSNLDGKKLVVLDEIGGLELMAEPFREKLYEILSSSIPCIGVIKSCKNKAAMERSLGMQPRYKELYQKLCIDIKTAFCGTIISSNDSTANFIKDAISTFMKESVRF